MVRLAAQAGDGGVYQGENVGRGTDRVGVGLSEQIQVPGDIRREPADSGVKGHPQFRPSAKAAYQEEAINRLENPGIADPVGPGLILDGLG